MGTVGRCQEGRRRNPGSVGPLLGPKSTRMYSYHPLSPCPRRPPQPTTEVILMIPGEGNEVTVKANYLGGYSAPDPPRRDVSVNLRGQRILVDVCVRSKMSRDAPVPSLVPAAPSRQRAPAPAGLFTSHTLTSHPYCDVARVNRLRGLPPTCPLRISKQLLTAARSADHPHTCRTKVSTCASRSRES